MSFWCLFLLREWLSYLFFTLFYLLLSYYEKRIYLVSYRNRNLLRLKLWKKKKHYYTELHTTGIKDSAKHYATESVCAHFSTTAEVGTKEFQEARQKAIEFIGEQQSRGWLGWQTGKTFVETGREEVSCMSPAWDYHKGRTFPVFEEIDVQTLLTPQL